MNVWIALAVVLLILALLAFITSRGAQDTRPMFLWGSTPWGRLPWSIAISARAI